MIAVFVTSHGFGHLNRTASVLNQIPADLPISIYCHASLLPHWHERLRRPFDFVEFVCDSGAVNPPGDSTTTDGPATLQLAEQVHRAAEGRRHEIQAQLRESGCRVVLSDAAALPLTYARAIGVPGYLMANFTWAEIYEPHARKLGGSALRFLDRLRQEYRSATAFLRTEPALAMRGFGVPVDNVGMIVTVGQDRSIELRSSLGLTDSDTLVYFYVGRYGQADLGWDNLARLANQGYHFISYHPAPGRSIANLHIVSPHEWTGADLAKSADVMVTKAGYGTVCEALASGTPMIYAPRTGFAEHRALDHVLKCWGGGFCAPSRAFIKLKIAKQLEQARHFEPGPAPFSSNGANRVASILVGACRSRSITV